MTFARPAGIVFDMDGTLTVPAIDFGAMRRALAIPEGQDILLTLNAWPPERRQWALNVIDRIEEDARRRLELQPGAADLLRWLQRQGIRRGLLTRNTITSVSALTNALGIDFSVVVTREFPAVKPHPDPLLHVCQAWQVDPADVWMVGDYRDDMHCGRAAGAACVLLRNTRNADAVPLADFVIDQLSDLQQRLAP